MTTTELRWNAPGPGPWEIEGAHFPKPIPYFGRQRIIDGFARGFAEGTARYGLLLSHFEAGFVNGFWYQQPAAFGAPKGAKGPPPSAVLWLLTRLHPGMRKRIRASRDAVAGKLWRDDLKTWDEHDKPAATKRHRELLATDPASLDDAGLIEHVEACEKHFGDMILLHHRYTVTSIIPTGLFLSSTADWTGKAPGEILHLLRGSTPKSNGISAAELEELAVALQADAPARAAFEREAAPARALDALRDATGPAGDAARKLLDLVWHRAVSYDLAEKSTGELPAVLVGAIRAALAGRGKARGEDGAARAKALRDAVPAEHRARFDELLGEARSVNRLRDERGLYADCLAVGIARRAVIELGKRFAAKGQLRDASHAVDLEIREARMLAAGEPRPSADEIAARVTWRLEKTVADAPQYLNGRPGDPPNPDLLPRDARLVAKAVTAVISNLFHETDKTSTAAVIRGISVNEGQYEGTARVISSASEFGRLEQGDVLVTGATAPYFNVVLPLLGAIVTDRGGQLCHAAIVAREYGIPAVVGTKQATKLIPDGARVRVDGSAGEVLVLTAS